MESGRTHHLSSFHTARFALEWTLAVFQANRPGRTSSSSRLRTMSEAEMGPLHETFGSSRTDVRGVTTHVRRVLCSLLLASSSPAGRQGRAGGDVPLSCVHERRTPVAQYDPYTSPPRPPANVKIEEASDRFPMVLVYKRPLEN